MPKPRRALLAAAALTAALTAAPTAAHAGLPVFRDRTIVPGKSIGGVALGVSGAKARAAWGRSGAVCTSNVCDYRVSGDSSGQKGDASFAFTPKVSRIHLRAPIGARGYVFGKPFTSPKTDRGIGIGSSVAALEKAYPKAREVSGSNMLQILGRGRTSTLFSWSSDQKRVFGITIEVLPAD